MNELVLATSNPGKILELQSLLAPITCLSQSHFQIVGPVETGLSFIENAILKARHASLLTNKPALADDSGLVVEALKGEPGIYSARYAGIHANDEDNIDLLLHNLANVPDNQRVAYFFCAIAMVKHAHDPVPIIACGRWMGHIAQHRQGSNGFGYDPIFFVESYQCTAAELPAIIKNEVSHRAEALKQFKKNMR